jgi:hypothetical protein
MHYGILKGIRNELQESREETERSMRETDESGDQRALEKRAIQEEDSQALQKLPKARVPRSTRVRSLSDMRPSFTSTAEKSVMDMQYCVANLSELRTLAGRNHLSNFSDFWAPDYKDTMPLKAAFTPEY